MILKFSHTQSIFQNVSVVATTTIIIIGVYKASDVAHPTTSTKFHVIRDAMAIVLTVHHKTNSFNSGVVAYKENSLMVVVVVVVLVATTATCRNMD